MDKQLKYCVYRHLKPCGEVFYVGIGNNKRPYSKKDRNKYWKNITNKYKYDIEILYNNLDLESAKELEIFLIKLYGRKDLNLGSLVNMTDGGDGFYGGKHSDETKNKMRIKHLNQSKETKLKRSNVRKGNKLSESTKIKMRLRNKNSTILLDVNTGVYYYSIKECAEILGIDDTTLNRYLNNKKLNIIKT